MKISLIAAVSRNNVIGTEGKLLWHLSADLKRFRHLTTGHSIIVGRKTFESIGKALPDRKNIVLTTQPDFAAPGCVVVRSVDEALKAAEGEEVFVIGGGEIYRLFFARADSIYLTRVEASFEGNVTFPEIDPAEWKEVSSEAGTVDEKNPYPHSFVVLERVKS